jgi:hypothetical protein
MNITQCLPVLQKGLQKFNVSDLTTDAGDSLAVRSSGTQYQALNMNNKEHNINE